MIIANELQTSCFVWDTLPWSLGMSLPSYDFEVFALKGKIEILVRNLNRESSRKSMIKYKVQDLENAWLKVKNIWILQMPEELFKSLERLTLDALEKVKLRLIVDDEKEKDLKMKIKQKDDISTAIYNDEEKTWESKSTVFTKKITDKVDFGKGVSTAEMETNEISETEYHEESEILDKLEFTNDKSTFTEKSGVDESKSVKPMNAPEKFKTQVSDIGEAPCYPSKSDNNDEEEEPSQNDLSDETLEEIDECSELGNAESTVEALSELKCKGVEAFVKDDSSEAKHSSGKSKNVIFEAHDEMDLDCNK